MHDDRQGVNDDPVGEVIDFAWENSDRRDRRRAAAGVHVGPLRAR